MRLKDKQSPALVLSGGGVKAAAFHIGVCLALHQKGFRFAGGSPERVQREFAEDRLTFKTYVGSSAGSVVSTFLAAGYSLDAIVDAFTRGNGVEISPPKKDFASGHLRPLTYRDIFALNLDAGSPSRLLRSLLRKRPVFSGGLEVLVKRGVKVNGLFTTDNIERYMREEVHQENTFSSLGVRLYVVATQLNHSRKVIFGPFEETTKDSTIKYANYASVSEAVAASAALPPFFSPYGITNPKGKKIYFFDGEIRDTLSTHVAAEHGADLVIASYSIQPYHFNKEMGSLHEYGIPAIFNQALYQVVQQKISRFIEHQREVKGLINSVHGYLKQADIPQEHRDKLMEILIARTKYDPNVDYIYIHPSPQDHEIFFADHFSLNPRILSQIVKTGFKAAMNALRKHT